MRATISGTGSYVPELVVTNEELSARIPGCDPDWIREKLGIESRRVARPDQQESDLAKEASIRAIEDAGLQPSDIDGIIMANGPGDVAAPATAAFLQHKLGIPGHCYAFDLKMACAGTIGAILMARGQVESGLAKHVLVAGAYVPSRTSVNPNDRAVAPIFGDGGSAVVVSRSDDDRRGILASRLRTDGSLAEIVGRFPGGSRQPLTPELVADNGHFLKMDGRAVWKVAIRVLPEVIKQVVADGGATVSDLQFVVSHQANKKLLLAALAELGVSADRTFTNVETYGNTGPASALLALDEAARGGCFSRGDLIVLLAIGAGMTWGAHLIRW